MTEYISNAIIKDVFLGFESIPPGKNFIFRIRYKTNSASGQMTLNPLVIPTVLKTLEVDDVYSLIGTYIRIKNEDNDCAHCFHGIMAKDTDHWISTDNRYFGEDYLIEECINWVK